MTSRLNTLQSRCFKSCRTESYRIPLSHNVALQIYSDTNPHNLNTAALQKGLIIVYDGVERVGEGTGFGVPAVQYKDDTLFSGSADVTVLPKKDGATITRNFVLNLTQKRKIGKIEVKNKIARNVFRGFAQAYRKYRHLRLLTLVDLSQRLGVRSGFTEVESAGKVMVTYFVRHRGCIKVKADFNFVKKENLRKVFLLNEQGSTFFRKYHDSDGKVLFDRQLSAWDGVNTEWAAISEPKTGIGFRLWKTEDAILIGGREFLHGSLDWIGLDYEINPRKTEFEYEIEILGV